MVRVAWVGNGLRASRLWLEALAGAGGRFEAVCDSDGDRAGKLAGRYGVRWAFTDCDQMFREVQPDLTVVAGVDIVRRQDVVKQALKARSNVVVDGPVAQEAGTWSRLSRAADRVGRFVMVGMPHRFAPAAERLDRMIASRTVDGPVGGSVTVHRLFVDPSDAFDGVFEAVDRVWRWFGPIGWVGATPNGYGGYAGALMMDGVGAVSLWVGPVQGSWGIGSRLELVTRTGIHLVLKDDSRLVWRSEQGQAGDVALRPGSGVDLSVELGYRSLMAEAIGAVSGSRRPAGSMEVLAGVLAAARAVMVRLDLSMVRESAIASLAEIARRYPGPCPLEFRVALPGAGEMALRAGMQWQLNPCDEVVHDIEKLLGPGTATLL